MELSNHFSVESEHFAGRLQGLLSISTRTTVLTCTKRRVDVTAYLSESDVDKGVQLCVPGARGLVPLASALTDLLVAALKPAKLSESDGHDRLKCMLVVDECGEACLNVYAVHSRCGGRTAQVHCCFALWRKIRIDGSA